MSELCAEGFARVEGPREVECEIYLTVEPARPGAARMQVELAEDLPPVLHLGDHGLHLEFYGADQKMLEELRDIVAGIALHGYEEWIRGTSDLGVAGLARVKTASGRRITISNNVAPWTGLFGAPRGEPRRYVPYSESAPPAAG